MPLSIPTSWYEEKSPSWSYGAKRNRWVILLSKGIQILNINICWQKHTLKYWSRAPFSMYSVIIMASLTEIISRREHPVKTCTVLWNGILKYWKLWFDRMILTFSDNALQTDNVLMGKLAHNTGFTKEVLPLLLSVAWLQGLYGYSDLTASWYLQRTTVHLTKFSCRTVWKHIC